MDMRFTEREQEVIATARKELQAAGVKASDANVRQALSNVVNHWSFEECTDPEYLFRGVLVTTIIKMTHLERIN